jgi:uncharacterized protein with gpF-like domain
MKLNELASLLFADDSGIDFQTLKDKTPEEVIQYFESKGLVLTDSWKDSLKHIQKNIFTVAGITKLELLQDVYSEVMEAIKDGISLRHFQKNLDSILVKKGWNTDENSILANPWRVNLIYRQNIQTAYQAGRMKQQFRNEERPYLQYIGVLDNNTRPTHEVMQKFFADKVLHFSHKLWKIWYPPCGFFCRCRVRSYTLAQVQKLGLTIIKRVPAEILKLRPDEGFDHKPDESIIVDLNKYNKDLADQFRKGA